MAGACKPGPLGQNPKVRDLNDGTMICGLSPRPGINGVKLASSVNIHNNRSNIAFTAPPPRKQTSTVALQVLRQGSRGSEVQKLQQQLNARLTPPPQLAIDGTFGPLTNQAVLQYQKGVSITADGVVGKQTWYHLLRGDKVAIPQTQATTPIIPSPAIQPSNITKNSTVVSPKNEIVPPTPAVGVWEWSMQDKFVEALRLTAPKLPASMRHEFEALLSPTSLGIIGGTLVFWAGSHVFGVGIVADIVLLIGGVFFLGMAIYDVAGELGSFLVTTSTAADTKDLDKAASHLARAIAIIGVAAFIALLAKVARGRSSRCGAAAESPSMSLKSEAPPKTAQRSTPKETLLETTTTRKVPIGHTEPTGSLGGRPSGKRTKIPDKADDATKRSLEAENTSADELANAGYKIEQNPKVPDKKNPDYLIEGKRFDCKAPKTDKPRNAASEIEKSVKTKQADRIVLNLDSSPIQPNVMKQQLNDYPIDGLKEVLVIKEGHVIPLWP